MKSDRSFPKQVLVSLVLVGAIASYPLMKFGSAGDIRAAIAGAMITTLNVLAGYAAIEYSFGKSMNAFFGYVIGGMGVRLLLMAAVLLLLIKVFEFPAISLVGSMGIFYVLYLTLEVLFIQRKIGARQQG